MNWISVEDRVPPFNLDVLVKGEHEITVGYFNLRENWSNEWAYIDKVTHWMYLPEPPMGD